MTDIIEQKMCALVGEVRAENPRASEWSIQNIALCRAIEQHEAFRQEVSDAVEHLFQFYGMGLVKEQLERFIIAKPDPLVVVLGSAPYPASSKELAAHIRADMKARGYEWRKIEGEG